MSTPFPTINESLQAEAGMAPAGVPAKVGAGASPTPQPSPQRGEGAMQGRVVLPGKGPLLTRSGWSAFIIALIVICAVAPVLNLWVPEGHALHMSTYAVALLAVANAAGVAAIDMASLRATLGQLAANVRAAFIRIIGDPAP